MHILTIDQGTTGTTISLVNKSGQIVGRAYREFTQIYPQPGWVEHNPLEIWQTVVEGISEVVDRFPGKINAVGITNQRETTVIWDSRTGQPLYNAIVWQCRRTADICETLRDREDEIRKKTGLPVDAYFSGTKAQWILSHKNIQSFENIKFGTIDTWLIWKLTGGRTHATDFTNASRTMLFNIQDKRWDPDLCQWLNIPVEILPEVKKSADYYGDIVTLPELEGVPVMGVAGDQQAALFGQGCFAPGEMKNTYGTGCFIMMNTGQEMIQSSHGLLTTLAADPEGNVSYALEGSVFIAGAAIQWLRDELGLITNAADSLQAAQEVADNGGVYLVPAFVGLGAPYWNMEVRGILTGLSRGTNRNHITRAALEAMAYQTLDVVDTMEKETGKRPKSLAVDGGASANDFLMQFQADILDLEIHRPEIIESTSLGAAYLAGLASGFWTDHQTLHNLKKIESTFVPSMRADQRKQLVDGWHHAVRQTQTQ